MSRILRKPAFCICENKDADQLRGNREADHRLCFRHIDSKIPLLSKSEISSLYLSSVVVQPGLCRTWSETPKTGFLTMRLKLCVLLCSTSYLITQTCPCNILQYFTAVKIVFFFFFFFYNRHFSYFCSKHGSWVHVRTASLRRF